MAVKIKFDKPIKLTSEKKKSVKQDVIIFADGISLPIEKHEILLQYCKDRLIWAKNHRDAQIGRFEAIDRELACYIKLNIEDAARKRQTELGHGPKPYPVFLPLTKTQLDEAMTFLMSVFFPEEGPYAATAPVAKQDIAKSFTGLMNRHNAIFKHFMSFAKFAFDGLKYNLGYVTVEWHKQYGTAVSNDDTKTQAVLTNRKLYDGNKLEYLDPYNTLVDPSVSPMQLAQDGEFFAHVEIQSTFKLRRRLSKNEITNVDKEYLANVKPPQYSFYRIKPVIIAKTPGEVDGEQINWVNLLSASNGQIGSKDTIGGMEFIKMRLVMDASFFGISAETDYTIWEIEILNSEKIVSLKQLKNAHGLLPIFANRPWDDNFGGQTQSFAEMLLPYQRFASFQLNIHQLAARKALYGMTFYNGRMFPDLANADMAGGHIATKSTVELDDIKKHVLQIFDGPKTENTLQDIDVMDSLMQKILPTDILKQVTDLERATEYQSAATVQGANRRNLKIAQTIDAQAFDMIRQVQMYNILEYQESMSFLDSKTGQTVEVNPAEYRDAQIEFILGTGLRGLDKLMIMGIVKDILAMLVQNQEAAAKFDVAAIINYLTSLAGDTTNFAQFLYQNEFDKLTPQQKQIALQLLQQAMQAQSQQKGQAQAQVGLPQGQ